MSERRHSLFAKPLQRAVEAATKPAFKKFGLAQSRLISDWGHIVGAVLAQKALPQRITFPKGQRDGGTVYLLVETGWALEVQHLEPVILEKIATYFGYRAVGRVHITQGPLPRAAQPQKKQEVPVPPAVQEQAARLTAGVEDAELQAVLARLGEGILLKSGKNNKAP